MDFYPINRLYDFTPKVESRTSARRNPLTYAGALNEAEFIDIRLSPQRSRAGILFDTRLCGDFEGSNTALVVLTGVGKALWSNDNSTRRHPWHAEYGCLAPRTAILSEGHSCGEDMWAVDVPNASEEAAVSLSTPKNEANSMSEYILVFGSLSVTALGAQIYIGHVDGLDGAIPDMTEFSDAEIIAGFPQWSSVMEVREHYRYIP